MVNDAEGNGIEGEKVREPEVRDEKSEDQELGGKSAMFKVKAFCPVTFM
jgi:hypothetical protein